MAINPMALGGRTVLVTGASAGLGKAIAETLAELDANVVLAARDLGRLAAVQAGLNGTGHAIESIDLSLTDAIAPWMKSLAARFGPLHGVVHCAGVMMPRPLRMLRESDWDAAMRLNVAAASALAKGLRQPGVRADQSSIVFLSSVTGLVGQPAQSLYGATKGALIAMARSLAIELAPERIRVNCIAPSVVEVGMSETIKASVGADQWARIVGLHPLGLGTGRDVAHMAAFLLADTGRWITGSTLVVDGGYTAQ